MAATDKIARQARTGESAEFDLGNYDTARINTLVEEAFSTPVECAEMVQFTFVIGGGKKVRQKYSPTLGKDFKSALIEKGFQDDSGAFRDLACQGSFKYQHNTDTDLISMHVFPFVTITGSGGDAPENGGYDDYEDTPISIVAEADLDTFKDTIKLKVQSYAQKMVLHRVLKDLATKIDAIDQKLVSMEALTPSEDVLYNSVADISSKIEWLTAQAQQMIDKGQLTSKEKASRRAQLVGKQSTLEEQIAKLNAGSSEKKKKKLISTLQVMNDQISKLDAVSPIKRVIKHADDLAQIKFRLSGLKRKIDSNTASLDDMTLVSTLEKKIEALKAEQEDLYWFEDPKLIEEVVVKGAKGNSKKKNGGGNGSSSSGGGAWTRNTGGGGGGGKSSKSGGGAGGSFGGFSALADDDGWATVSTSKKKK